MYQNQYGSLAQALQRAGLNPSAATEIARILSNPQQTLRTGPIEQDLTPRNMRQVRRDDRLTLPGFDQREDDPYFERQRTRASEERDAPKAQPNVTVAVAPQQDDTANKAKPGAFIDTSPDGDSTKIGLRLQGIEGGMVTAAFADNSLRSRRARAESDASGLRFFIEEQGQDVVWKLMFVPAQGGFLDVVTDVRLGPQGIEVSRARIYPLAWGPLEGTAIPVVECP